MKRSRWLSCLAASAIIMSSFPASATNGYFLIGYGAKSRGMGGTGVALAQDGTTAAVNPAGLSDVGTRADVVMTLFQPKRRSGCCTAVDGVVSGSNLFAIPTVGGAFKFNKTLSFGFAAVGAGANTRFNNNFFIDDPNLFGTQPDGSTLGVSLIQLVMAPGASYSFSKNHSFGASLLIGVQQFRAYGLSVFKDFSAYPDNVTNQGNDFAYGTGGRVGWRSHFFKKAVTFGATYASKVYMQRFEHYKGLFADEGGFDIPENYAVGIAVRPHKKLTIAMDAMKIMYSDVPAVGNESLPITASQVGDISQNPDKLGHIDGPGFGWSDQEIYKLGVAYDLNRKWTVRAGYNYGKTPITENDSLEFNVLAPATTEKHFTLGGSYSISRNHELNFAATHARRKKLATEVASDTQLPFPGPIETETLINTVEVGYSFSF